MGGIPTPAATAAMRHAAVRATLAEWFGLSRQCAGVLTVLYEATEPMYAQQIATKAACNPSTVVRVHLYNIRQALECGAIDGFNPGGYFLTDIGRAECAQALRTVAGELVA